MTTLSKDDIPSTIDTVEKLAVWAGLLLNNLYYDQTTNENVGEVQRIAQAAPFELTASDPIQWRLIIRESIGLERDWLSTTKVWTRAKEIGTKSIPSEFKE